MVTDGDGSSLSLCGITRLRVKTKVPSPGVTISKVLKVCRFQLKSDKKAAGFRALPLVPATLYLPRQVFARQPAFAGLLGVLLVAREKYRGLHLAESARFAAFCDETSQGVRFLAIFPSRIDYSRWRAKTGSLPFRATNKCPIQYTG